MSKNQRISFVRFTILLALMVFIVGCSSDTGSNNESNESSEAVSNNVSSEEMNNSDEGESQQGGEIVIGYYQDLSNWDPIKANLGTDQVLLWPVYDTLVKFNANLEVVPGIAESWEFIDDETIVFTLREGVTFRDGTPVDAEAVKFNIERALSDESIVNNLDSIESVKVVDDKTVEVHLSQPDVSVVAALADRGGMLVSPTAVKEHGEDYSQQPAGAGPYKVVDHVPNGEIILEAHEDYWQEGQPYLDKMTIKIMTDETTRINALKSGEIDFTDKITAGNVETLEQDGNINVIEKTGLFMKLIYLNTDMAPLDNKKVRQAIQHAINREELVQAINFGKGEASFSVFPSEHWAGSHTAEIDYDPEKSKQLLKEAGFDNVSFKMVIQTPAFESRIAEAIKGQLSEVGIQMETEAMELNAATAHYFTEKQTHAMLAASTGQIDPHSLVNGIFAKDSFYNVGAYTTPEIEELIAEGAVTDDQDERAKLYGEINEKIFLEEAMALPVFYVPHVAAMNSTVKGYEPNLLGKVLYSELRIEE